MYMCAQEHAAYQEICVPAAPSDYLGLLLCFFCGSQFLWMGHGVLSLTEKASDWSKSLV